MAVAVGSPYHYNDSSAPLISYSPHQPQHTPPNHCDIVLFSMPEHNAPEQKKFQPFSKGVMDVS
jgi:hypothetical protein